MPADPAGDRDVAGFLAYRSLIQIRALASRARRAPDEAAKDAALEEIRYLADLVHNVPLGPPRPRSRPHRPLSRRDRAMRDRRMTWTWETAGERGRRWILDRLAEDGYRWVPPPPLPVPRKNASAWTLAQRLRVLAGWPVRTPPGCRPLPRQARVVKELAYDQMCELYGSAAIRAHLDPEAAHYLFPDARDAWDWPSEDSPQWHCRVLLRMTDGESITGHVPVRPETFVALPSTLNRLRQRRIVLAARMLERDYHLWRRDREVTPP